MKSFWNLIGCFLAVFAAESVYAVPMYAIDSTRSYVSAYAPNWTAYNYTPPYFTGPGAPPPPTPIVVWDLTWTLEKFGLSGNFQGATDVSPWVSAWAHLTITDVHLQNQLPTYIDGPILPWQVTYAVSDGEIQPLDGCGLNDAFGPFYYSGFCTYTNGGSSLAGTFNGATLELWGASGAIQSLPITLLPYDLNLQQRIVNPGSPPYLEANPYPTQWVSYHIVANAVPEPGTLSLILMGGLIFIRRAVNIRTAKGMV